VTDTWMAGIARLRNVERGCVGGQRRGEFGDGLRSSSSHGEGELDVLLEELASTETICEMVSGQFGCRDFGCDRRKREAAELVVQGGATYQSRGEDVEAVLKEAGERAHEGYDEERGKEAVEREVGRCAIGSGGWTVIRSCQGNRSRGSAAAWD
jgi:hypothetical protein